MSATWDWKSNPDPKWRYWFWQKRKFLFSNLSFLSTWQRFARSKGSISFMQAVPHMLFPSLCLFRVSLKSPFSPVKEKLHPKVSSWKKFFFFPAFPADEEGVLTCEESSFASYPLFMTICCWMERGEKVKGHPFPPVASQEMIFSPKSGASDFKYCCLLLLSPGAYSGGTSWATQTTTWPFL